MVGREPIMFVDVYAIQNVPPCNINRDDTGSPKSAFYGGALRARVSSQAWKRAMRELFPSLLPEGTFGVRTKHAAILVAERIKELVPEMSDKDVEVYAVAVLGAADVSVVASKRAGSEEGASVTQYLIFIAQPELDGLAHVAAKWYLEGTDIKKTTKQMKKEVSEVFHGAQAIDIALFGRMLADAPGLNTDASAQVAHAISVDKISQEYDYFTAIDDCASEDNAGAGMIGSVGFNSSTLYRYATVNADSLSSQLGNTEAAAEGIRAFVEAFVRSMPTGKQNTFANRTLPGTVIVAVRETQPINAVSAFENPVRAKEDVSISRQATERLATQLERIESAYGEPAIACWGVLTDSDDDMLAGVAKSVSLPELLNNVYDAVLQGVSSEAKK